LVSGSNGEYAIWSAEKRVAEKTSMNSKVLSAAWTSDGLLLALGLYNGTVLVKDKDNQQKFEIARTAPVWCLQWNPVKTDSQESTLAVGCWDQSLSFWSSGGQQIGADKSLEFDPCTLDFLSNGEFLVVGGSDKKLSLWTKEGINLGLVDEQSDWIWSVAVRPRTYQFVVGTNDGVLTMRKVTFHVVHGLYQDRYGYRDLMTDVVIQHLKTEQIVRIKCRDLVKKIAVYRDRLAVQLPDRVVIYAVAMEDEDDMRYKSFKRINKEAKCHLLALTSSYLVLCFESRISLMDFSGDTVREWNMDSSISHIRVLGGPPDSEGILVGLKGGEAYIVYVDNPFPVLLLKQSHTISYLDLSCLRKKVAIVDDNHNLFIYSLSTQTLVFQDTQVDTVSWNSDMDDVIGYSGKGVLSIKAGQFAPSTQKVSGIIVGFRESRVYSLQLVKITVIDVPQSAAMYKYLELKQFADAYTIACLGVTETDWRNFAVESIQSYNFKLARKALIRIKDVRFLELLSKIENDRKQPGYNDSEMLGEISAFQGRYTEAASLFERGDKVQRLVDMYKDLGQHEKAQEYIKRLNPDQQSDLIRDWAQSTENSEWQVSAKLYISVGDYKRAVRLIGSKGNLEWLIEICRQLNKAEHIEALQACATIFRTKGQHAYAKEAYLKLGDTQALLQLHIELHKWEDAFRLAKQNPELQPQIYLPYAEWLVSQDRFEEAQDAFKQAQRPDVALRLLERMTRNYIVQRRFTAAARYYWKLSIEHLHLVQDCLNPTPQCSQHYLLYEQLKQKAEAYYAYDCVRRYVEEPFHVTASNFDECVFNASRMLVNILGTSSLEGVKPLYIYYSLGKIGRKLQAYKTARFAYEKLQSLSVPAHWQDEIELAALVIRAKPLADSENLLAICSRCLNANQLLNFSGSGDICTSCKHPIIRSFSSFTPLPLVEFEADEAISVRRVNQLIHSESPHKPRGRNADGWHEKTSAAQQSLQFGQAEETPFDSKVAEFAEMQMTQEEYHPVVLDEETLVSLSAEEVYTVDLTKDCPTFPRKYYKLMIPEIAVTCCINCHQFYMREEFELAYLEHQGCPFCGQK
jgi:intraflagellar transport protein 122